MRTSKKQLFELIEQLEPRVRNEFFSAIRNIKDSVSINEITSLLKAGKVTEAYDALQISAATFAALERQISFGFIESGELAAQNMRVRKAGGGRVVVLFDARNHRAERYLQSVSSGLITNIVTDQRDGIRNYLSTRLSQGANPRTTAVDLVGRIDKRTGRRSGGVIGLNSQQMRYVANMQAELSDPKIMKKYFTRQRRDKRFDSIVLKALREEKPLDTDKIAKLSTNYTNKLLQLRGETIARTETIGAVNSAQHVAFESAVDAGTIKRQDVKKIWQTALDGLVRDSHASMHGESVGLDQRFSNGLLYPGEAGAPAEEVINDRCIAVYDVDFLAGIE
jgi:uncharacterized short protein YbdD (DUF466 family)